MLGMSDPLEEEVQAVGHSQPTQLYPMQGLQDAHPLYTQQPRLMKAPDPSPNWIHT